MALADAIPGFTTAGLLGSSFYGLASLEVAELLPYASAFLASLVSHPLTRFGLKRTLRKRTTMMITPESFAFKSGSKTLTFDRRIDHSFSLKAHDKTKAEARKHDHAVRLAQKNGKVIQKKPYYGESFHIIYNQMNQRNDITVVYGQKEALAVLNRLKACDTVMNMQATKGRAVTMRPEDEWGEQPGQLPAPS